MEASCQWFSLSSSFHNYVLCGVVYGVELSLDVCALGFGMLSRVLVGLCVGADVPADADPYVELDGLRVLFSLSGVAFCSRVMLAKLSVTAQRISC